VFLALYTQKALQGKKDKLTRLARDDAFCGAPMTKPTNLKSMIQIEYIIMMWVFLITKDSIKK
jgi:hypothetical protein